MRESFFSFCLFTKSLAVNRAQMLTPRAPDENWLEHSENIRKSLLEALWLSTKHSPSKHRDELETRRPLCDSENSHEISEPENNFSSDFLFESILIFGERTLETRGRNGKQMIRTNLFTFVLGNEFAGRVSFEFTLAVTSGDQREALWRFMNEKWNLRGPKFTFRLLSIRAVEIGWKNSLAVLRPELT